MIWLHPEGNNPDMAASGNIMKHIHMAPFETMLMWDPDFIFTITPAPEPAPRLSTLLPQIPPLRGLGAVRSSRVIELSNDLALRSPGPRVDQLIETITDTLAQ